VPETTLVNVNGRQLKLTNLSKTFYPEAGLAKKDVISYYARIAPFLLPHLAGRPLTLKRYPDGAGGSFFYQKECPAPRPGWIRTVAVWSSRNLREVQYCVVDNLASLVWTANLAAIELHTSLSLAAAISQPTAVVFDLDPGPPAAILECAQAALWLKDVLDGLKLESFPKTSGSKGLQIYVPINTSISYEETKGFARAIARLLEAAHPDSIVSKMPKALRHGKVFIDWSQNDPHKTTVCVYSLRATKKATVSTPVTWEEVAAARENRHPGFLTFNWRQVLERTAKDGDLFAPVLTKQQKLPQLASSH